jgi:putative tryptophan/tyrosine transport system substrate-binding protein
VRTVINRRFFLNGLGGAAASPFVARAQAQGQALPVIGFLSSASPLQFARLTAAFGEGLNDEGFVHNRNVLVEMHWAHGKYEDLPALAATLAGRKVALITATGGVVSAQAAKSATTTIPIVFVIGSDPVKLGLVASINKPGGNATGVTIITTELAEKRMQLLKEIMPMMQAVTMAMQSARSAVPTVALLVNPGSVTTNEEIEQSRAAALNLGLNFVTFNAANEREIPLAFEQASRQGVSGILISADPFFTSRRSHVVALAAKYMLPTMYPLSAYVEAGGLLSYGTELPWAYRQAGIYAGRILKGARASELPIMMPSVFDLVINTTTAKALGITVPNELLARANQVLE